MHARSTWAFVEAPSPIYIHLNSCKFPIMEQVFEKTLPEDLFQERPSQLSSFSTPTGGYSNDFPKLGIKPISPTQCAYLESAMYCI